MKLKNEINNHNKKRNNNNKKKNKRKITIFDYLNKKDGKKNRK